MSKTPYYNYHVHRNGVHVSSFSSEQNARAWIDRQIEWWKASGAKQVPPYTVREGVCAS